MGLAFALFDIFEILKISPKKIGFSGPSQGAIFAFRISIKNVRLNWAKGVIFNQISVGQVFAVTSCEQSLGETFRRNELNTEVSLPIRSAPKY